MSSIAQSSPSGTTDTPKGAAVARIEPNIDVRVASQTETAAVLSMIERLAKDPSVDIDRVERMMTLHREMRAERAREAYNIAMAAVQARLPQVKRDAANKETHSRYARLETIAAAVDPIIAEAGLSLSYGTEPSALPNHYRVVCTVSLGAHERRFELDTPADGAGFKGTANKTAVQAMGSTLSYARRYLKLMIFDIALTNEDNDGNGVRDMVPDHRIEQRPEPRQEPRQQRRADDVLNGQELAHLRAVLDEAGWSEATYLKQIKVERLEDIYANKLNDAVAFAQRQGGSRGR